jgi:luciferase-like monooxygenase
MRFSIRLNNDLPLSAYPDLARAAEEAGFHQFWVSNDLFLRSVCVILSEVAAATRRIAGVRALALVRLGGVDEVDWTRFDIDWPRDCARASTLAAKASSSRAIRGSTCASSSLDG